MPFFYKNIVFAGYLPLFLRDWSIMECGLRYPGAGKVREIMGY